MTAAVWATVASLRMREQGVRVRPAEPGDAAGIAACQGACWQESYARLVAPGFFDDKADGAGAARWGRAIDDPAVAVAVAVQVGQHGDVVVGFASAGSPEADRTEPDGSTPPRRRQLFAIYLRASLHGTGAADGLMARSVGSDPAHVWVFEDNPRARAFYSRHGFLPDGARAVNDWTGQPEVRLVR